MARRRPPDEAPAGSGVLPAELHADNVSIEVFVDPDERPGYWSPYEVEQRLGLWRQITALRRWQAAVLEWGAERGLGQAQLRAMDGWPSSFPPPAGWPVD